MKARNGPLLMPRSVSGHPQYLEETLNVISKLFSFLDSLRTSPYGSGVSKYVCLYRDSLYGFMGLLFLMMECTEKSCALVVHSTVEYGLEVEKRAMDADRTVLMSRLLFEIEEDNHGSYGKP